MASIAIASQASVDAVQSEVTTLSGDVTTLTTTVTGINDSLEPSIVVASTVQTITAENTSAGAVWSASIKGCALALDGNDQWVALSDADTQSIATCTGDAVVSGDGTTFTTRIGQQVIHLSAAPPLANIGSAVYATYQLAGGQLIVGYTCDAASVNVVTQQNQPLIIGTIVDYNNDGVWIAVNATAIAV